MVRRREKGLRSRSSFEAALIALRISSACGGSSTRMIGRPIICSTERQVDKRKRTRSTNTQRWPSMTERVYTKGNLR